MQKLPIYLLLIMVLIFPCKLCIGRQNLNHGVLSNPMNVQESDTGKLATLARLINYYKPSDPLQALTYSNKLFDLATELNNQNGVIDALTEKGRICIDLGFYDSALVVCEEAIRLCDSVNDTFRLAKNFANYGYLMYMIEDADVACKYYRKSYNIYKQSADTSAGMAEALNGMAAMLMEQSNLDSAIYYYLVLVRLCEDQDFQDILGKAFINLGIAYDKLDQEDKAAQYFRKSIIINEKLEHLICLGKAYNSLGNIAIDKEQIDEAWFNYNKAVELSEQANYNIGLADGYIGLGNVAEKRKDFNKALKYYILAGKLYNSLENKEGYLIAYKNEGLIYQQLGNFDKAINIFDSCLIMARELNLLERVEEIYGDYTDAYQLKKDYQHALEYYQAFIAVRDTILNIEKAKIIAGLEMKYEKEKDSARILQLENENLTKDIKIEKRTNQRNRYLYGGSSIILMFIFFFTYYQQRTRKNRIINEQRIKQLEEEKKLLAARSLVEGQEEERKRIAKELHDGLGVLLSSAKIHFTTVRDKSPENKPLIDKAAKLLEQATRDVRRISHNMMPGLLTKFGFFEAVEGLFDEIDDIEGLHAQLEIKGEPVRLKENTEIMVYRIVQELVNNTLKHANASTIRMKMEIQPGVLVAVYEDDGKGFNVSEKKESKSIGLNSIISRVKFLGGDLKIDSDFGKGVKFSFDIPIG
ncbi:MAG: sensor histidine kinase [Bacteroidales bacterium]